VIDRVDGWVWADNVHRLMRHLAHTVAYDFDDLDWGAVETGLTTTDAEQARWFDYPLVGKRQLNVGLAREPDAYPVMVRVSGELDDVLIGRIETLIAVFSDVREDN
jgi:hypothetical protein